MKDRMCIFKVCISCFLFVCFLWMFRLITKKNICSKTCCFIDKDVIVYCLRIYSILSDQGKEVLIVNIVKSVKYFAVLPCGKK